ncbi:MAG: type IX secretion system protein PorQ [Bacteroidales bacterium]|nr:type IX secretion system protein PorQ [Bacteroidales bacterium]
MTKVRVNRLKRVPHTCGLSRGVAVLLFVAALSASAVKAQVAGLSSLSVLDMPASSHAAAFGMDYVSLAGGDISAALDNPSIISPSHNGQLSLTYMGMKAGTNFGTVAYGHTFDRFGSFVFGLRFCSYGFFEGYTYEDVSTGRFSAADYILSIGWGRAIDSSFSIGVNFKPVYSHYEGYSAFAIAFDVAGSYVSPSRRFSATIMGRNIGAQIATFDNTVEHIPYELTAGLSYKLKNAPFRFFFNYAEMQRWDLRYDDALNPTTETDPFTGQTTTQSPTAAFFDKLGRHLQAGVELSIGKVFKARMGYNYRKAAEMHAADVLNTSGLSFGVGFSWRGFDFAYSHNNYHLWQAPNYISITTDLRRFIKQ